MWHQRRDRYASDDVTHGPTLPNDYPSWYNSMTRKYITHECAFDNRIVSIT